jgi:hypothetical protein
MRKRVRCEKTKLKSKALASSWSRVLNQPFLLEGEDAAAYNKLLSDVRAAIEPIDIIDDIFADVVADEWEVLRWRRLKTNLMREFMLTALKDFLRGKLDYTRSFVNELKRILEENFPNNGSRDFAQLVDAFARDETDAVDEVRRRLRMIGCDSDALLLDVQTERDDKLVRAYVQHEPHAVSFVNERLQDAGTSMDRLLADVLADGPAFFDRLNKIERIDRMISVAEQRRNASLHEIERRRPVLADALRRTVQDTEERELKLIDTTAPKGDAA